MKHTGLPSNPSASVRVLELYTRHGRSVRARCRRLLANPAAADDATQEIFLRVLARGSDVPANDEAVLWLQRVATNHCLNQLRGERLRRPAGVEVESLCDASGVDAPGDRSLAQRILERTPEKLRRVAWLYYVQGLNQSEIARALGLSRRTVVTRLGEFHERARAFVRDERGRRRA